MLAAIHRASSRVSKCAAGIGMRALGGAVPREPRDRAERVARGGVTMWQLGLRPVGGGEPRRCRSLSVPPNGDGVGTACLQRRGHIPGSRRMCYPLWEMYIHTDWWPHHSKIGNEVVSDVVMRKIAVLVP